MHKNQIWIAFLATCTLIVLWFTGSTGYDVYLFATQNKEALPQTMVWSVKASASDKYYLGATYSFRFKDRLIDGETDLDSMKYKNFKAAESMIPVYRNKTWKVWYNPANPSSSSLQKFFPIKSCVYTLILWAVLLYFISLGFYVAKIKVNHEADHS